LKILTVYPLAEVTFFGIENVELNTAFIELDLNLPSKINLKYDLVICAQVLEHVWNLNIAFENLSKLLNSDNGLLWINCPASNMVHGSPEYFSAGYSLAGSFGSRRLYFFTHALQFWPTKFELEHPILTFRPLRSYGRKIVIETIRGFFGRTYSVLLSSKQTSEPQYATESFALAKSKGESPL
jgi:SAM-dependent methyltransferase